MSIRILQILVLLATICVVAGLVKRPKVPERNCKPSCMSMAAKAIARRRHPEKPISTCHHCCIHLGKKYIRGSCSMGTLYSNTHCYCQKSAINKVIKIVNRRIQNKKANGKKPAQPGKKPAHSGEAAKAEEASSEEEGSEAAEESGSAEEAASSEEAKE